MPKLDANVPIAADDNEQDQLDREVQAELAELIAEQSGATLPRYSEIAWQYRAGRVKS